MAVIRKTVDLLPSVFRTDVNRKFLGSTVDQLVSDTALTRIDGFIGRQFSPTHSPSDNYLLEPTAARTNYQLEPTVVVENTSDKIDLLCDYNDLINKINYYGGKTDNHDRLFSQEYYTFDPRIDLDKFVNYSQYYWLPDGPAPVTVSTKGIITANTYTFTAGVSSYTTNRTGAVTNPTIYLARGVTYALSVNHAGAGNLWIQTEPGVTGRKLYLPQVSSRNILGVTNNGEDSGTIVFAVPTETAQDSLLTLPLVDYVNYATSATFTSLDGSLWTQGTSTIDGDGQFPKDRYIIFTNTSTANGDWTDRNSAVVAAGNRYSVWKITVNHLNRIELSLARSVAVDTRIKILDGGTQEGAQWRRTSTGYSLIPDVTAPLTTLYYQNDSSPDLYGEIRLVDAKINTITVNTDIVGKTAYVSPDGVRFTNGMMVYFDETVEPAQYRNRSYIVEGVGTAIRLVDYAQLVSPEVTSPEQNVPFDITAFDIGGFDATVQGSTEPDYIVVNRSSMDLNAWSRVNRWFHIDVIRQAAAANGTTVNLNQSSRAQRPIIEFDPDLQLYNAGRIGIGAVDQVFDANVFLNESGTVTVLTDALSKVHQKTFASLKTSGINLRPAQRVVFANDADPTVRKTVYRVDFVNQLVAVSGSNLTGAITARAGSTRISGTGTAFLTELEVGTDLYRSDFSYIGRVKQIFTDTYLIVENAVYSNINNLSGIKYNPPKVNLTSVTVAQQYDSITVMSGSNAKKSYYLTTSGLWKTAQQKTAVNQEPLFDIITTQDVSLTNAYLNSTFAGTKLFSYSRGSTVADPVLGFSLSYSSTGGSIGQLNFTNNYCADTFAYTSDSVKRITTELKTNVGFIRKITGRVTYSLLNTWNRVSDTSKQYQQITAVYDGLTSYFELGAVPVIDTIDTPSIKIYINNRRLTRTTVAGSFATITGTAATTTVTGANAAIYATTVNGYYNTYLGRHADQTGLDYWVNLVNNGTVTLSEVEARIIASEEAYRFACGFELAQVGARTAVKIRTDLLSQGDRVDILFYSTAISELAHYEIPKNLEFNPQNSEIAQLTLGQLRNHLQTIGENTRGLIGSALAQGNIRDLDITAKPGTILQHSAPIIYSSLFLSDSDANFINSIDFARREYTRFKNKFLELSVTLPDVNPSDISHSVDVILESINTVKNNLFPWYYSDMMAHGSDYNQTTITVLNASVKTYNLSRSYRTLSVGSTAVLIYRNGTLLVKDIDFVFDASATFTLSSSVTLNLNDTLVIREYANTEGSYVPETPSKLGLYPKFVPAIYTDTTYRTARQVIQGHDGSITPAFGDYRDNLLLELEKRIYNNIKTEYTGALFNINSNQPGKYRTTAYTNSEYRDILNTEFLKWVGYNQLDFASNTYFLGNDEWSWNYSGSLDIDDAEVSGYWRGIYRYYYDTDRPHTHPWEIMGYAIKPNWWDTYYSWTDPVKRSTLIFNITNGLINDPGSATAAQANPVYARPGFSSRVPVNSAGQLLSPMSTVIKKFNDSNFNRPFAVGDQGPVESAWYRSSEYAFAVQRAMALMRPAEYFGRLADTFRYGINSLINQYVRSTGLVRGSTSGTAINGEVIGSVTTRSLGYLNWVQAYLTSLGRDGTAVIRTLLDTVQVKLSHKLAGFTDRNMITVLAEQFSPTSTSESVIIPDENYQVHLNRSVPVARATYSAVIIERSENGYTVSGYDLKYPYFIIVPSETAGTAYEIGVLDQTAVVYEDFKIQKVAVPYGYEFTSAQQVVDFLVGYERWLIAQGFIFDRYSTDFQLMQDFKLAAREFLTWDQQGWQPGNIIVVSPVGDKLDIFTDNTVVDYITNRINESQLMGVNFNVIKAADFSVIRDSNLTTIFTLSGQSIAFAELNLVQYEHALVFDNTTVFNDIIYKPDLGNRQYRLRLVGAITSNWDGQLTPPGYIYNTGNIADWATGQDYRKGDIVRYKLKNYTAAQDVAASDSFNYNYWTLLDSVPESGLSANFVTGASRSKQFYDVDDQPLDEQFARFSNGLIGFRNRTYLENLGMNTITQTKFYQGYIREKGTKNSIAALSRGQFNNISSTITVYEEWAARVGEYGAIDSNPYISLALKDSVFRDRPMAIELLSTTGTASDNNVIAVKPHELTYRPDPYTPNIFLTREPAVTKTFKIELFGDGIMCGRDPAAASMVNLQPVVACRDDRTTARVASPPDYLLYQALNSKYNLAITTRSVENSTSAQLLSGGDSVNGAWPDDIEADIVVINHGMIDAKNGISVVDYKSNLRALRTALKPDQMVIWQTPSLVNRSLPSTDWSLTGTNDVAIYAQAMREVAAEYNDVVADAATIPNWTNYLGTNGVYPSQQGYTVLVNTVLAPAVEKVIRKQLQQQIRVFEDDVKTAGYVNQDHVDHLLFDLYNYSSLTDSVLSELVTGYKIWVAKDFNDDWQVYRAYQAENIVTRVEADIDNRIVFTMESAHGLAAYDVFAVRGMDPAIDGFYQALIVDANTVTVLASDTVYQYVGNQVTTSSTALLFDLQKLRFANNTQRDLAVPKHGWLNSDRVWIDDSGDALGSWAVYDRLDTYRIAGDRGNVSTSGTVNFTVTTVQPNETVYYTIADGATATVIPETNAWTLLVSQPMHVDIDSISNCYLFSNKTKEIVARLDILDPAKGRLLGVAQSNIDYTTTIDPARYSNSSSLSDVLPTSTDYYWAAAQVGKFWWNIDTCRFVDYEQGSLTYRLANWAKLFPGSSVDVYEWIESDLLPSEHVAAGLPGVPLYANDDGYSRVSYIDPATNIVKTKYYYWLHGHNTKISDQRTHTSYSLEQIIAAPEQQGIPYLAPLSTNAFALFNVGSYLSGSDTVVHVSYRRVLNERIIHSDYKLIQQGDPASTIPDRIESKIIDSVIGSDALGLPVPSPILPPSQRLGLGMRPKQTVVLNADVAKENLVKYVNSVLIKQALAGKLVDSASSTVDNFFARDPIPAATEYLHRVSTYSRITLPPANVGERILVERDERNSNYWTIYQRTDTGYKLLRRQQFDVTKLWSLVDWYADGYSAKTNPDYTVNEYKDIYKLPLVDGTLVQVLNSRFDFASLINTYRTAKQTTGVTELYRFDTIEGTLKPILIGRENGTFQLSDDLYAGKGFDSAAFDAEDFDNHYMTEWRYIMQGLKHDIFVADLAVNYNQMIYFLIDYILSEQRYIDWFFKTSFVKVLHQVSGLVQSPTYIKNRQENYESYVREVKPYRTKIRDYTLGYDHVEKPRFTVTDFDIPAYYDTTLKIFRSPNGEQPSIDAEKFTKPEYQDWVNNHGYSVTALNLAQSGYGYRGGNAAPSVSIIRRDTNTGTDAEAKIFLNSDTGGISRVSVTSFGSNYTLTPTVTINGNGGTIISDHKSYAFRVTAKGQADTSGNIAFGLYSLVGNANVSLYTTANIGYTMHRIRRSDGQLLFTRHYELPNELTGGYTGYTSADLANDLNDSSANQLVVVHTLGDARTNRLNNNLDLAMYRCGASPLVFGNNTVMTANCAYLLVGIPGVGQGNGLEIQSGNVANSTTSFSRLDFKLRRSFFIPTVAQPKTANSDFAYSSSLGTDLAPHYAVISPRLENNTIRKLKTTMRFDRIQYTTQVVDWQPGGFDVKNFDMDNYDQTYAAGTYVAYRGEAYVADGFSRTTPYAYPVVGSLENPNSRTYRHGFFDNANDRIMAYYQPTADMIPKDLERLIPGIRQGGTTYAGSGSGSGAGGTTTIMVGDTFSSMGGLPASNITVTGGSFVNELFSHAPEELLPGQTFESLQIRVMSNATNTGFHLFKPLQGNVEYATRNSVYTTTLTQALLLTDTTITVADGTKLAAPDPLLIKPGILYVNGERIAYYSKVGNVLSQINRGYGGTGAAAVHPAGSSVEDVSERTKLPTVQT